MAGVMGVQAVATGLFCKGWGVSFMGESCTMAGLKQPTPGLQAVGLLG